MNHHVHKDVKARVLRSLITLLLVAIALKGFHRLPPAAALQNQSLEDLWIDLRIGPPLISLFNQAAQGNDIARVDHYSQLGQLAQIENGRKLVIFKSIEEAEEVLPDIAADFDIIGYNLEQGQVTPAQELNDPVTSVMAMRELADQYGLELAFGPDHNLALSHGVQIAPYVDIFVLQIQRQQTNRAVVKDFVEPIIPELRAANPDLQVSVQVRTEGSVPEILDLLEELEPQLDGISILTSPDTVDVAEELVYSLRPDAAPSILSSSEARSYALLAALIFLAGAGYFYWRRRQTPAPPPPTPPVD